MPIRYPPDFEGISVNLHLLLSRNVQSCYEIGHLLLIFIIVGRNIDQLSEAHDENFLLPLGNWQRVIIFMSLLLDEFL